MSKKYEEADIDGFKVVVNQYSATEGFKILTKLTKMLGPSIAKATGGLTGSSLMDMEIADGAIGGAIDSLVMQLDPDSNLQLILRLLASTTVDNQPIVKESFDLLFQGKIFSVFKIIKFALEVNYKDFLGEGGLGGLLKKAQSAKT